MDHQSIQIRIYILYSWNKSFKESTLPTELRKINTSNSNMAILYFTECYIIPSRLFFLHVYNYDEGGWQSACIGWVEPQRGLKVINKEINVERSVFAV